MKRKLVVIAEYIEEWDENEDNEYVNYTFDDWANSDWDCVGRPLDRLVDEGWTLTKKQIERV